MKQYPYKPFKDLEARVGFEPTNGGFADLSLRPLGYRAETTKYSETGGRLSARCRGHELRFGDKARVFFGRLRTDVESRAPLESRHFGELGNNFDVPVVVVVVFLTD